MTYTDMNKVKKSVDDGLRIHANKHVFSKDYGHGDIIKFMCHGTKAWIRFDSGVKKLLDVKNFKR